ncbi:MAG: hypothetical protein AB1445_15170 [Bacillota bacterium]
MRSALAVTIIVAVFATGCTGLTPQLPASPPVLRLSLPGQSVTASCNGARWPGMASYPENWPPATPSTPLFLEAPGRLSMVLDGTAVAPERVRVEVLPSWRPGEEAGAGSVFSLHSAEITRFSTGTSQVSCEWDVPELPPGTPSEAGRYTLRVTARWAGPAEAVYYVRFQLATQALVSAVKTVPVLFAGAAWAQDQQTLETLLVPGERGRPRVQDSGPLSATLYSSWNVLFWRPHGNDEYRPVSAPQVVVKSVGPAPDGPYAEARLHYQVEASARDGTYTLDVTETYYLERQGEAWLVQHMERSAVPRLRDGEPGWRPQVAVDGQSLKLGPFTGVDLWGGPAWSQDGQKVAFAVDNFGYQELWACGRQGEDLRLMLALPLHDLDLPQPELHLLDWMPDDARVRFLVSGYQVVGPHAGHAGFWFGEVSYPEGEVQDVAFIPASATALLRSLRVTADGTSAVFVSSPDLWRVDLLSGEVFHLAGDLPGWDGLFVLHYSPSGWHGAYASSGSPAALGVYDLRTGKRHEFDLAPGDTAFFAGWTPGGLMAVAIAREVTSYGETSWPAGCTALRFYDTQGGLKREIVPPDHNDRIRHWDWTEDDRILVFTVGPRVPPGGPSLVHGLWLWQEPGKLQPLAVLTGEIDLLTWVDNETAVEVWQRARGELERTGVRISLSGTITRLTQATRQELELGRLGAATFLCYQDGGITRVVARRPGQEDVLIVQGEFAVREAKTGPGTLVFVTHSLPGERLPLAVYLHFVHGE